MTRPPSEALFSSKRMGERILEIGGCRIGGREHARSERVRAKAEPPSPTCECLAETAGSFNNH